MWGRHPVLCVLVLINHFNPLFLSFQKYEALQFRIRSAPTPRAAVTIISITTVTNIKPSEVKSPRVLENEGQNVYTCLYKCHACPGSYRPWGCLRPPASLHPRNTPETQSWEGLQPGEGNGGRIGRRRQANSCLPSCTTKEV